MKAAQVVSVITENQSTALIAPRFMVGKPNAASIASIGNSSNRLDSSVPGLSSANINKALKNVSGSVMCSASCRSEEHTSELQSLMRISYAVFCLKNKKT